MQTTERPQQADGHTPIHLTVQVETKSGMPVPGLAQSNFTLLDGAATAPIKSFQPLTATQEPVEVILVFDALNARFDTVAAERTQIEPWLRSKGANLPVPFSVAVLTEKGITTMKSFSRDGNGLAQTIEANTPGLREITRASGFWGAEQRLTISLRAIDQLIAYAGTQPGRKLIFFVSPGWPILSGPGVNLTGAQEDHIFSTITQFSRAMRNANVTLYSLNPLGAGEALGRVDYYEGFLKGVSKPSQTDVGDLAVQVLALQSGGLALNSTGVSDMVERCLADGKSWYELSFEPAPADKSNEYRRIQVKVDRPDVKARTRNGYYTDAAH